MRIKNFQKIIEQRTTNNNVSVNGIYTTVSVRPVAIHEVTKRTINRIAEQHPEFCQSASKYTKDVMYYHLKVHVIHNHKAYPMDVEFHCSEYGWHYTVFPATWRSNGNTEYWRRLAITDGELKCPERLFSRIAVTASYMFTHAKRQK